MGNGNEVIPEYIKNALQMTSRNVDEVKANLEKFLISCDNKTLSRMDPLERARALNLIAETTTTLVALRLKCRGVNINDHPIKKEFERLGFYQEKLQHYIDLKVKQCYDFGSSSMH